MTTNKKAVKLFLLIVVLTSAVWESLIIITGQMGFAAFLMWMPALAAWIVKFKYFRKEKHALLFSKCKTRYILYAMLIPMIYLAVPYVFYWITNKGAMQIDWNIQIIGYVIFGTLISMITALGEEIGWRGFLVPRLITIIGLEKTLLLIGLIWGLWHCPILISGIYMPGTPVWFKVPMFIIIIGGVGVIIGILTLKSKSVWPAAVMHAVHNNYDQTILGPGTVGDNQMFFVSETGIYTAVIVIIIAVVMYLFCKKQLKEEYKIEKHFF